MPATARAPEETTPPRGASLSGPTHQPGTDPEHTHRATSPTHQHGEPHQRRPDPDTDTATDTATDTDTDTNQKTRTACWLSDSRWARTGIPRPLTTPTDVRLTRGVRSDW